MTPLDPLVPLFDARSESLSLLPELARWYGGGLSLPEARDGRPGVYSNFVTSLDGRITFDEPGVYSGGDISFRNPHDRYLMGLLRSASDAILVGAETLRVEPKHVWTARGLFRDRPDAVDTFARQRAALGLPERLLHVFVTGSGRLGGRPRVLDAPDAEVLFLTTPLGKAALDRQFPEGEVQTLVCGEGRAVDMDRALRLLHARFGVARLLCEGGPTLLGALVTLHLLDHAFLSMAPQIIGDAPARGARERPTWVSGYFGQPDETPMTRPVSLKMDPERRMIFTHNVLEYRGHPPISEA